jgi:PEP-CTERM motif
LTTRTRNLLCVVLCTAAAPIIATPLTEPACTVGNGCQSDRLWVVDPSGAQVYGKSVQESQEVPNAIYFIGVTGLIDRTMYGKPNILLDPPDFTMISDAVGVVFVGGDYYLGFKSDSDTGTPAITFGTGTPTYLNETDARVDVTKFLNPALRDAGYTAYFRSDVVETSEVPEPATVVLLGAGLCVAGAVRKRVRA